MKVTTGPLGGDVNAGVQPAPPAYDGGINTNAQQPELDISASFSNLILSPWPQNPTNDSCLAHLKLLFAFQALKEDIGYTDGLWGLWNTRATGTYQVRTRDAAGNVSDIVQDTTNDHNAQQGILSQVREKRWALFVARAVDRYESWWNSMKDTPPLHEQDMENDGSPAYDQFPDAGGSQSWIKELLPPLDVLMVWHSHMLNPRAYLEDCMRAGLRRLWWNGMPWHLVNEVIDTTFNYVVSDDTKTFWVANTERSWDNSEDAQFKTMPCPMCSTQLNIRWTTCGAEEQANGASLPSLIGCGYGDGELSHTCHGCGTLINKDLLIVAKFRYDVNKLVMKGIPMPGTVLEPKSGKPESFRSRVLSDYAFEKYHDPLRFPNRLVQQVLFVRLNDLMSSAKGNPGSGQASQIMEIMRRAIEDVLKDSRQVDQLASRVPASSRLGRVTLSPTSRIATRKMMSRYWDNFSPFALDLCGAVMRQGVFVEKMYHLDWLHSPVAAATMSRICTKYQRFLELMDKHPRMLCVPTLDIDLAWHTHQLSPSAYYSTLTTTTTQSKFIDHDDKINEDKLSQAFEATSKLYQETYQEVYSECTCWYCETLRSSHISSIGKALGISNNERLANHFHESGAARLCPPNNSAHISAHNAVTSRATDPTNDSMRASMEIRNAARLAYQRRLEHNYEKACKRAGKKGRTLPPKDEYYNHWGYQYYMYAPYMYPPFTPGLYYTSDPNTIICDGSGCPGACAAGSCGGAVAAGGCGGPGGCGGSGGGCGGGDSGGSSGGCGGGGD